MGEQKVPSYPELGKLARDLFRRGYHPGIWQIETKTLTSSGIELLSSGFANHDNTKVNGMLQSKYKMEDQGLTLSEGWNTDKWLFGEIMHKDKLAEGLTLALAGRYQPAFNELEGKFKVGFVQEKFHILADTGLHSQPILNASLVVAQDEFLGGVGCEFDISNVNFSGWKVALGYAKEPATVHAELRNGGSWLASLFYKVNDQIDAAVEIARAAILRTARNEENPEGQQEEVEVGGNTTVSLGMIYHVDENALIRAKVNSAKELGLGYEQKFGEGITASISAVLDFGSFSSGNHRFGVGVALQC
ncbi:voltage-dependent anion-selective channel [Drosophila serrata]|uniref:voltage-dependent anion-selective channel n=1 Tax=Drosophila serrata TaxID=7274 RepID=UPI000A1D26B8|nr:voltage-dependent anion-selective channel [Drosophila serrata]KAH8374235.1 hypothetical protein KR200_004688 [Drosophila serrata]